MKSKMYKYNWQAVQVVPEWMNVWMAHTVQNARRAINPDGIVCFNLTLTNQMQP